MGKGRGMTTTKQKITKRLVAVLALALALCAFTEPAEAQQILLTGPLAGAPAVRKLRLRRKGRFEIAPAVSFTLLDEYQRTILLGGRLNYNFTDWLSFGAWGAVGSAIRIQTHLTDEIQSMRMGRPPRIGCSPKTTSGRTSKSSSAELTGSSRRSSPRYRSAANWRCFRASTSTLICTSSAARLSSV
jgi:hypothetical protein